MVDNKISLPGSSGGLVRFDEEYKSRFMISPTAVIAFIVIVILLVIALKIFMPVA